MDILNMKITPRVNGTKPHPTFFPNGLQIGIHITAHNWPASKLTFGASHASGDNTETSYCSLHSEPVGWGGGGRAPELPASHTSQLLNSSLFSLVSACSSCNRNIKCITHDNQHSLRIYIFKSEIFQTHGI